MTTYELQMVVTVKIEIENPDDVIGRVLNNVDDWQGHFYPLKDRDGVLEHLAYNCIVNGVEDARRLDGWADLGPGLCKMEALEAFIDTVDEVASEGAA